VQGLSGQIMTVVNMRCPWQQSEPYPEGSASHEPSDNSSGGAMNVCMQRFSPFGPRGLLNWGVKLMFLVIAFLIWM
jgi:hypothetical protein